MLDICLKITVEKVAWFQICENLKLKLEFSQNNVVRSISPVDGTDQKLKSGPDPLLISNIPLSQHSMVP